MESIANQKLKPLRSVLSRTAKKKKVYRMSQHLTYNQKKKWYQFVIQRDGENCFYCMEPFENEGSREWDHLDNNTSHNYPENLVHAHHSCNVKKITNQLWQDKAIGKLKQNQRQNLVCGNELADTGTTEQLTSSQAINKTNRKLCVMKLTEYILHGNTIKQKDYVNAMANLCQEMYGTGSSSTIYRYVDEFTNPLNGKFTLSVDQDGDTIIRRRTEN